MHKRASILLSRGRCDSKRRASSLARQAWYGITTRWGCLTWPSFHTPSPVAAAASTASLSTTSLRSPNAKRGSAEPPPRYLIDPLDAPTRHSFSSSSPPFPSRLGSTILLRSMLHRKPPPPLRRLPCAGRRSCSPAATADIAHSHSSGGRRRRSRRMKTTLAPSARFAWHLRCLLCSRRCPITQRLGLRASADRSPTPPTGDTRLASHAGCHSYVLSTVITRRHVRHFSLSAMGSRPASGRRWQERYRLHR